MDGTSVLNREAASVVDITGEMIEAGREAYASYFLDLRHDEDGIVSRKMVSEVSAAMEKFWKVSPSPRRRTRSLWTIVGWSVNFSPASLYQVASSLASLLLLELRTARTALMAPVPRACRHNSKPKNRRSARHSMPVHTRAQAAEYGLRNVADKVSRKPHA